MATSATSSVYIHVIEDVVEKVREEFLSSDGPGEDVLRLLQGLWETKMMQAGVILGHGDRPAVPRTITTTPGGTAAPVADLNMPYEAGEEYETPTADMLFPPTPLQTPLPGMVQTPQPGTADNSSMYNIPTGGSDYPTPQDAEGSSEVKGGRPSPYMQSHSPWMNSRPPLDVNVAYDEGREEVDRRMSNQPHTQDFFTIPTASKRKRDELNPNYQNGGYIPQQDGAGDSEFLSMANHSVSGFTTSQKVTNGQVAISSNKIPQLDGPVADSYDDALSTPNIYNYQGVVSEDYNIANTPAPDMPASTPLPIMPNDPVDDDDDEPLNENDDDDLDDVDDGEELNTQHLVLAQFDKVTRTKSRWKCTLKDGIMHINDKDILFNKAMGEFEF